MQSSPACISALSPAISKTLCDGGQAVAHAAVINIATHLDAHSADQRRLLGEEHTDARTVYAFQSGPDAALQIVRQGEGALDLSRVPGNIELHQTMKLMQYGKIATMLEPEHGLHNLTDT